MLPSVPVDVCVDKIIDQIMHERSKSLTGIMGDVSRPQEKNSKKITTRAW